MFPFVKYTADELKIAQIPQLLADYKQLALENMQLKKTVSLIIAIIAFSIPSLPPPLSASIRLFSKVVENK